MARGWKIIARKAAGTIGFWLLMGLIPYFGISAVIKIEATGTRLFLVVVVFGVAFGAASLLERLLRGSVPTGIQPNVKRTEIWPRWYSGFKKPIVYRQSNHVPYSYVVLPRPKTRQQQPELLRKAWLGKTAFNWDRNCAFAPLSMNVGRARAGTPTFEEAIPAVASPADVWAT